MIDLHTHILPGIDDGAAGLEDSLAMAEAAVADGVRAVAATPHVRDDYPTAAETMERLVGEVQAALADFRIALELLPGGEVALERLSALSPAELHRFGLAGNPSYLLVECPYVGWPLAFGRRTATLLAAGVAPVLAHPERNVEVQEAPERLRPLVEAGALVQVTAASVDGRLGRRAQKAAEELLDRNLVHLLASDAHTPGVRAIGMSDAVAAIGDENVATWLARDVPAAIVAREALPPRPPARRRPRLFRRR